MVKSGFHRDCFKFKYLVIKIAMYITIQKEHPVLYYCTRYKSLLAILESDIINTLPDQVSRLFNSGNNEIVSSQSVIRNYKSILENYSDLEICPDRRCFSCTF